MNMFEPVNKGTRWEDEYNRWQNNFRGKARITDSFATAIAFESARMAANKLQEQERLVPTALISAFENDSRCQTIINSLRTMEADFQGKSPDSLVGSAQSALEAACNLSKTLIKERDLDAKLKKIKTESSSNQLFGVQDWLIDSFLNIYKPIRNKLTTHKKINLPYATPIPMPVAIGYSFLVLIFLDMVLVRNKLIKK